MTGEVPQRASLFVASTLSSARRIPAPAAVRPNSASPMEETV
ncbi:MAG: hypothetical protein WAU86_00190 [Oricola sp.]